MIDLLWTCFVTGLIGALGLVFFAAGLAVVGVTIIWIISRFH